MSPQVSLVIPVFNGRRFLRQAVDSALAERKTTDVEILVVDDGSTDGSADLLKGLDVQILKHKTNRGIAAALNTGFQAAKGAYLSVLDSDDWLAPRGILRRIDFLKKHTKERAVAARPAAIVDESGVEIADLPHLIHPQYLAPDRLSLSYFRQGGMYPLLTWLFLIERKLCQEVGDFDTSLQSAFDCDFLFRVLERTDVPVLFEPVAFRRWHESNHSLRDGEKRRELKPRTIDEVITVCKRYGIQAGGDFLLWETGYR